MSKPIPAMPGYSLEARTCDGCAHFRDMGVGDIPICRKLLMAVGRNMRVTFRDEDGTCWESAPPKEDQP